MSAHGRGAILIYCNMEKIIYLYAEKKKNKSSVWASAWDILSGCYPVLEKRTLFLGIPVTAYAVMGLTAADILRLERNGRQSAVAQDGRRVERMRPKKAASRYEKSSYRRLCRTLRKINRRISRKEQKTTEMSEKNFIVCQWEDCILPPELLIHFYRKCQEENIFVFRAQQLIFVDGWKQSAEAEQRMEWDRNDEPELRLMREIYSTYNYATVVTQREEFWQEFAETAYEEYGLSVRCTQDDRNLRFREKPTLIVDMCRDGAKCCRNFPQSSVYMDLRESGDKMRRISAKCREIPYISLRNALDTVLKDTL